jgi:hypothetical protein
MLSGGLWRGNKMGSFAHVTTLFYFVEKMQGRGIHSKKWSRDGVEIN